MATERGYKWDAHTRWQSFLSVEEMHRLIRRGQHAEVARRAIGIEARTNLLFSFEKMAIRDAVRSETGSKPFAEGLLALLEARGRYESAFDSWIEIVRGLPRKQTRVLTWPVLTVFPFIALPGTHVFLKPNVTRRAAAAYDFEFTYASRPNLDTYREVLAFARRIRFDHSDLRPRDMIDIQSFIWVMGSDEYPG